MAHVTVTFLLYSTCPGDSENFKGFSLNLVRVLEESSYGIERKTVSPITLQNTILVSL